MGRRRKVVKEDITDMHKRLPPCRVCEGPAGGFHYGVNTCEACKGFFHRNANNYQYFKCDNGGMCKVIYSNHKVCKKCRYDKCISVGMAKHAIKTGRYSLEKRTQDTLEIKSLRTTKSPTSKYKIDEESRSPLPPSEPIPGPSSELSFGSNRQHSTLYHGNIKQDIYYTEFQPSPPSTSSHYIGGDTPSRTPCSTPFHTDYYDKKGSSRETAGSRSDCSTFPRNSFYHPTPPPPPSTYTSSSTAAAYSSSSSSTSSSLHVVETPSPDTGYWSDVSSPSMPSALSASAQPVQQHTSLAPSSSYSTTASATTSAIRTAIDSDVYDDGGRCSSPPGGQSYVPSSNLMCDHCSESEAEIYELYKDKEKVAVSLEKAIDEHIKPLIPHMPTEEFEKRAKEHVEACHLNQEMFGPRERLPDNEYDEIYAHTGLDADGRQLRQEMLINLMELRIRSLAKFAKCIPGFSLLSIEDQVQLIKHSRFEILYVCGFHKLDRKRGVMLCGDGKLRCQRDIQLEMNVSDLMEKNIELHKRFEGLELRQEEKVLLSAILVMAPDRRTGLSSSSSKAWLIYQELHNCLIYLFSKRCERPLQMFARVISMMVQFRSYDHYMSQLIKNLRFDKYSRAGRNPLLREMLDFGSCDDAEEPELWCRPTENGAF